MIEKLMAVKHSIEKFVQDESSLEILELRNNLLEALEATNNHCEFEDLKALLHSDEWPQAVYSVQIADENSEKDKDERAEGIADILLPSLDEKKFLDFGCGEGHVAKYASKFAKISVGYDVFKNSNSKLEWDGSDEKLLLTTDFEKVILNGPYDIILIYDVMDHAHESDPKKILSMAKSVLADGGKIYIRNHPWASRHGGHLYRKLNKAFVHLVFTKDELSSMGIELEENMKIVYPIDTYKSWLSDSGLKNSNEPELDEQNVEVFFKNNSIVRNRIMKTFGKEEWTDKCPEWQMRQCFWDYVLEKE